MRHTPQFEPVISPMKSNGFTVTAPRDIREHVYKIVDMLQDGVVKVGGEVTTISLTTNPGYDTNLAQAILAVATYIAIVNDISALLKTESYQKHLSQIEERIHFVHLAETPLLLSQDIAPWIDAYIYTKSTNELKRVITGRFNINDFGINEAIKKTMLIRNRILVEVHGFKNAKTKRVWLKLCTDALAFFEAKQKEIEALSKMIKWMEAEANITIDSCIAFMAKSGPVGRIDLYDQAHKYLNKLVRDAEYLRGTINKKAIADTTRNISTLLPAEK